MLLLYLLPLLFVSSHGLITWPLQTTIGSQQEALKQLTGDRSVYATCNYILFPEHANHETAASRCQDVDIGQTTLPGSGTLATIDNEEKNNELSDLMKVVFGPSVGPEIDRKKYHDENWCWIGLYKVANLLNAPGSDLTLAQMKKKAKKLKGTYVLSDWMWEDGSPPNAAWMNWDNDQPDQYPDDNKNTQNNVRMYKKGLWDDSFAYKTSPYACNYNGKYIVIETKMNVADAKMACATGGFTLAKVRSAEDNAELVRAISLFVPFESPETWDPSNWVWIGVTRAWEHYDGEAVNFRNFSPDIEEYYVAVNREGTWDDSYNVNTERPFACMCPDSEPISPPLPEA